jgi:hypothetical protein
MRVATAQADRLEDKAKSPAVPHRTQQQGSIPAYFDSACYVYPNPLAPNSLLWFRFALRNLV